MATNRKVAGLIPDGVTGIFHWYTPSDRTMALGSTQPLTEMSTREFPGGKCGRCVRLTTLPPSCAVVMKFGNLNFLEPSGPLLACNGTALPLPSTHNGARNTWCRVHYADLSLARIWCLGLHKVTKCKLDLILSRQELMEPQRDLEFLEVVFWVVMSCSLVDIY